MTNTQYKIRTLPKNIKGLGTEGRLVSFPSLLFAEPWREALGASDYTLSAYRPLISQHTGGPAEWMVPSSGPVTAYPLTGLWREIARTRTEMAPGCALALRVVALQSGQTRFDNLGEDELYAPGGRVRMTATFRIGDGSPGVVATEIELDASQLANGAEPDETGQSWGVALYKYAPLIHIGDVFAQTPSEVVKWSEGVSVEIVVEHQGGARVVHCSVVEVPHVHGTLHTEEIASTIHGWPPELAPTARPQTEDADGVTYEEHRLGTARGYAAALRQSQRLGSTIASFTSYTENLAEVDDAEPDPIAVTSTSFVGLSVGSAITSWSSDALGYDVAGHYARRVPENMPTRLANAGVIPVRVRVLARFTFAGSNKGYVRFQTSSRSWVDVVVDQAVVGTTFTWVKTTGFLECGTAADDNYPVLIDFARVTGDQMEVRYWRVEWGDLTTNES